MNKQSVPGTEAISSLRALATILACGVLRRQQRLKPVQAIQMDIKP